MAADNNMFVRPEGQTLPPEMVDPNWNVLNHLSPFHQKCYMHHQRHRLNHLKALSVYHTDNQHILLLDEAGFLSAVGVPLPTREQLQSPAAELIYCNEEERKRNEQKLLGMAVQVLNVLQNRPGYKHAAWKMLQQLLETDLSHHKAPTILAAAVKEAIQEDDANYENTFYVVFDDDFLETPEAEKIPFDRILESICLAIGHRVDEQTDQLGLLSEIDGNLSETVLEFRDMYQRMNAYVAQNGTKKTKTAMMKLERLNDRWEKIIKILDIYDTADQMRAILMSWKGI